MNVRDFLLKAFDKEYEQKPLTELCKAPISAISGISETDAASLKDAFGITVVEELAENKYVLLAQAINIFSKYSGKVLDKEFDSAEFEKLRKQPVLAISGISDKDATLLKNAFGINTIQDLAENKYIKTAQLVTANARLFETTQLSQPSQPSQPKQTTQTQPSQTPPNPSQCCK